MKVNFNKTKIMIFNPCRSKKFTPNFSINGSALEVVSETKLLGLNITSDLKWKSNTSNIVKRASKRLWVLRRLKVLGADMNSLVEVYVKQVRSLLEFGVPAWQGSITIAEKLEIERVQKIATRIILGRSYISYDVALKALNLDHLEERRMRICLNFALKAEKHTKFKKWFVRF